MTASPAKPPADSAGQAHYLVPEWTPAVDPDELAKALVLIAENIHQAKGRGSKPKHQAKRKTSATTHNQAQKGETS